MADSSTPVVHCAITFDAPVRRPAAGQSAVFYRDEICLGGGIIV